MPQQYLEIITYANINSGGGGVKPSNNIYHFKRSFTVFPVLKSDIEGAFQAAIQAKILLALSIDYVQTHTTVRFFDDATDAPTSFVEAGVGAIALPRNADMVATTIQLKTGLRGRSYRGSKHYSPIALADTVGDVLTAGAITRFNTVATAIVTGFIDANANVWFSVIKSNKPPAQYTVNPCTVVATTVQSALLNKSLGTMKRRKIRTIN